MFSPSGLLYSLISISWRRADYYADELVKGLRLGLTGCRPFLTRRECVRLRARLVRLETIVRRILVLIALEVPLPAIPARAGQGTSPARSQRPPMPRRFFTQPVFRLAEPRPRGASSHAPRRTRPARLRPRILRLDQPLPPPEPGEYPTTPDDLIPATDLIRRARALDDVFRNPARHIARMARRLARDRASPTRRYPIADRLPSAARSPRQDAAERAAAFEIHDVTSLELARLDTS